MRSDEQGAVPASHGFNFSSGAKNMHVTVPIIKRSSWNKGLSGLGICKPNSGSFRSGERKSPSTEFKKGMFSRENHRAWKGGRRENVMGYVVVNSPGHPRAYRNEVYEHIIVAEKKIGRFLEEGEVVHHINGIKNDNRSENLIVFKNNAEHMKAHRSGKWSRLHEKCVRCGTTHYEHEGRGLCSKCYR